MPKVVFLTAISNYNTRKLCMDEGADYFLTKPIDKKAIEKVF